MERSTVQRSLCWRLWHSIMYLIAGTSYFICGVMRFNVISSLLDGPQTIAEIMTFGSLCFVIACATQWYHYCHSCSFHISSSEQQGLNIKMKGISVSINYMFSALGSYCYLFGSIFMLQSFRSDLLETGHTLIIVGGITIYLSESWKIIRLCCRRQDMCSKTCLQLEGSFVYILSCISGLLFFSSSFIFENYKSEVELQTTGVLLFSIGALCFLSSGYFLLMKYFTGVQEEDDFQYYVEQYRKRTKHQPIEMNQSVIIQKKPRNKRKSFDELSEQNFSKKADSLSDDS